MSGLHLSRLTLDAIEAEYVRAHVKHSGHTPKSPRMSDGERLAILVEEIGEVARSITYDNRNPENLVKELVQVAAMSAAWAEHAMTEVDAIRNGLALPGRPFPGHNVFSRQTFTGPTEEEVKSVRIDMAAEMRAVGLDPNAPEESNPTA